MRMRIYLCILMVLCVTSMSMAGKRRPQAKKILTFEKKEKELISISWSKIREDEKQLGDQIAKFYNQLKEKDQKVRDLFSGKNSFLIEGSFIKMLGICVRSIENPDDMIDTLKKIGLLHHGLGLNHVDYGLFAETLAEVFATTYCELCGLNPEQHSYKSQYLKTYGAWKNLIEKVGQVLLLFKDGGFREVKQNVLLDNKKKELTLSERGIKLQGKKAELLPFEEIDFMICEGSVLTINFNYDSELGENRILVFESEEIAGDIQAKIEELIKVKNRTEILNMKHTNNEDDNG